MSINLNQISFKAKPSVYIGNKSCTTEEFNKKMYSKINQMMDRQFQTNQIMSYFLSNEGKSQLERIPEHDEIIIAPLNDNTDNDGEIDSSNLKLEYIECIQDGEYTGELKNFTDNKVPSNFAYLNFNENNPFNLQKVKGWLDTIASFHENN